MDIDDLKQGVESQHGGTATYVESMPVAETFNGKTVLDGTVAISDLDGCPVPPAPTPGRLQSRGARNGGSSPCFIWGVSDLHRIPRERLSSPNIAATKRFI